MKPIDLNSLKNYLDLGYFSSSPGTRRSIKRNIANKMRAWELSYDYYDGDRDDGYGGFTFDDRWNAYLHKLFISTNLISSANPNLSVLDVGCKKGFLLQSLRKLYPNVYSVGVENHRYPLSVADSSIKSRLLLSEYYNLPFEDHCFDLVIAFSSIYMYNLKGVINSIREIQRVSSNTSYISLAAYNHDWEKDIFMNWTLLGTTCLHISEWLDIFNDLNYTGYYVFTTPTLLGFSND
ncbi:methyltransferase domain-containing protein [Synechococcus sp. A15-28]|uniref:methyltransferase domain-containing protein n=1 Tax=Synechococcus sp. A15-28 TaxID=1050638 RepID=UPI0016458AC2|nr:methyltransferase domain-containing protein [Synechococcus sp. A15-28]